MIVGSGPNGPAAVTLAGTRRAVLFLEANTTRGRGARLAELRRLPSREKHTLLTEPLCPRQRWASCPVAASQTRTLRSIAPLAMREPSGAKHTPITYAARGGGRRPASLSRRGRRGRTGGRHGPARSCGS